MAVQLNELTVDEGFLTQFHLGHLLGQWESTDIHLLCLHFRKHAEVVADENERNLCLLLWAVTSFLFKPQNANKPYGPMSVMRGTRSPIPADFSDQQLAMFLELAQTLEVASLRARLADAIWVEKRKLLRPQLRQAGDIALASFLTLANEGLDAGNIHDFWEAFERATRLASQLKADVQEKLVTLCRAAIPMMIEQDAPGLLAPLLMIAKDWQLISNADVRAYAEESATRCEGRQNWHAAADMLYLAASTCSDNEREQANVLKFRAAEVFERATEFVAGRGATVVAAHFQARALELFRRVGGAAERREQCHQKLLEYQLSIRHEMQSHSNSVDVGDIMDATEKAISGKEFLDAILILVCLLHPPSINSLVEHQNELIKQNPLSTMFGGSLIDRDGKTIAKFDPVDGAADDLNARGMRYRVVQQANLLQQIHAQAMLQPAMQVISAEHSIRAERFYALMVNSSFVPEGREHVFCIAFERMFENRLMEAVHLLLPQFENSIRHILRERGVITVKAKNDMTQEDLNLNEMIFGNVGRELEKVLGNDLIFDLQSILVDRFGPNLRNAIAHGKAVVGEMYSHHALYFC